MTSISKGNWKVNTKANDYLKETNYFDYLFLANKYTHNTITDHLDITDDIYGCQ